MKKSRQPLLPLKHELAIVTTPETWRSSEEEADKCYLLHLGLPPPEGVIEDHIHVLEFVHAFNQTNPQVKSFLPQNNQSFLPK